MSQTLFAPLTLGGVHKSFDESPLRANVAEFRCVNVVVICGIGGVPI